MLHLNILIICLTLTTAHECQYEQTQIDGAQKKTVYIKGDVMIGAMFPIHEAPSISGKNDSMKCGNVREQYGIQRVEVALKTIDEINNSPNILPNVSLGIEIWDTCWSPLIALHQSLQFAQISSVSNNWYQCRQNSQKPDDKCFGKKPPIIGVIGPASSEEVIQVQNLLQLFHIPQIGYSSTSAALSDKKKYEYFLRVVPSDHYQALVMIKILQTFEWNFVFAMNSEGEYGTNGISEFQSLAEENNICIAAEFTIKDYAKDEELDEIIRKFDQNKKAKIVVCFCEGNTVRRLLEAAKRMNKAHDFVFIGSDGWAGRDDVVKKLEDIAQGNIMIRLHSPYVPDFDPYYLNLIKNISNENRNPWFNELLILLFNCSSKSDADFPKCSGNESLMESYVQDPKLSFIVKSIYSFAYALNNYRNDICGKNAPACAELYPINGTLFKEYLRRVSFIYRDEVVKFDNNGDPVARYDILNYQISENGYNYVVIGNWDNHTFNLKKDQIQLPGKVNQIRSVCSELCSPGYRRLLPQNNHQNRTCCWSCIRCEPGEISDGENCQSCKKGYKPDPKKRDCIPMPHRYVHYSDPTGIACTSFSAIGILSTLVTIFVFYKYGDTPVVKSSTKELCYIMFGGMILVHLCTFIIIGKPTKLSCFLEKILPGVGVSIIFSALLVKTNRISRIFAFSKKRFPSLKPRFMSTRIQVYICCVLISLEFAICASYLYIDPANVKFDIVSSGDGNTQEKVILECCSINKWQDLTVSFAFNIILLLFCTFYAFKTRKLPHNFNEVKCIGFACYATIITWLAFFSIYVGSRLQILSQCISLSMCALINLIFLFFPKIYVILWRPQKNCRAHFTTTKNLRCHLGSKNLLQKYELLIDEIMKSGSTSNISNLMEMNKSIKEIIERNLNQFGTKEKVQDEMETKSNPTSLDDLCQQLNLEENNITLINDQESV